MAGGYSIVKSSPCYSDGIGKKPFLHDFYSLHLLLKKELYFELNIWYKTPYEG
jgi:hypothetical protein